MPPGYSLCTQTLRCDPQRRNFRTAPQVTSKDKAKTAMTATPQHFEVEGSVYGPHATEEETIRRIFQPRSYPSAVRPQDRIKADGRWGVVRNALQYPGGRVEDPRSPHLVVLHAKFGGKERSFAMHSTRFPEDVTVYPAVWVVSEPAQLAFAERNFTPDDEIPF